VNERTVRLELSRKAKMAPWWNVQRYILMVYVVVFASRQDDS